MNEMNDNKDFQMIRERMKERPVNRQKLLRRTVITAVMAVIFGMFACLTFIVLEPVFSNLLTPEEKPDHIEIPLDEDEMLPSDMMKDNSESKKFSNDTDDEETLIDIYSQLHSDIYDLVSLTQKSLVTVVGVSQDLDWFNNEYENKGTTTGIIVANNSKELLILCDRNVISKSEEIHVTFYNGLKAEGIIKKMDDNTGLAIVAIDVDSLNETLLDPSIIATLGNSKPSRILASPVIALGRPLGVSESVEYGMITSKGIMLNMSDSNYEMLTTDMYGNELSNGIIINMSGEVLGVISQHTGNTDTSVITVIGISDIKRTIERLSNGEDRAVLGVTGTEVTSEAVEMGVPVGAYITSIDMDSPAMQYGIQSGDVIVKINNIEITSFSDLSNSLYDIRPESNVTLVLERYDGEQYRTMKIDMTLGSTN